MRLLVPTATSTYSKSFLVVFFTKERLRSSAPILLNVCKQYGERIFRSEQNGECSNFMSKHSCDKSPKTLFVDVK